MASTSSFSADRLTSATPGPSAITSTASNTASAGSSATRSNALQNRITSVLSASYADLEIRDALAELDARGATNTAAFRRDLRLDAQADLIASHGEIVRDFGAVAAQLRRIGDAVAALDASCVALRRHISTATRDTAPMLDEARAILRDREQVATKQQLLRAFSAHFVLTDDELLALTSTQAPVDDAFFNALTRTRRIHTDSQILLGGDNQRLGLEILDQTSRTLDAGYQKLYRYIQREVSLLIDLETPSLGPTIRHALRVLAERPRLFSALLDFLAEAREQSLAANFYAALTGTTASSSLDASHPILGKPIELSAHDPLRYVSDMLAWMHSAAVGEREALSVLFLAEEGEALTANIRGAVRAEPWVNGQSRNGKQENGEDVDDEAEQAFDAQATLAKLLDRVLAGIFRQLKHRVEQLLHHHAHADSIIQSPVLATSATLATANGASSAADASTSSSSGALLSYRISRILHFYSVTLFTPNVLRRDSPLITQILLPLAEKSEDAFRAAVRENVLALRRDPAGLLLPSAATSVTSTFQGGLTGNAGKKNKKAGATAVEERFDLGPPEFLVNALELLKKLYASYESSATSGSSKRRRRILKSATPAQADAAAVDTFTNVIVEVLAPQWHLCAVVARKILRRPREARWIFAANCVRAVRAVLKDIGYGDEDDDEEDSEDELWVKWRKATEDAVSAAAASVGGEQVVGGGGGLETLVDGDDEDEDEDESKGKAPGIKDVPTDQSLNYLSHARQLATPPPSSAISSPLRLTLANATHALTLLTHVHFATASSLIPLMILPPTPSSLSPFYTDPAPLIQYAESLDAFLPTAADDARAIYLGELRDRGLCRHVVEVAAERFVEECERIEGMVREADEEKEKARGGDGGDEEDEDEVRLGEIWRRTGEEMRVLLS